MPLLPMSPQVFSILSALVADRVGLHFDSSQAPIFGEKVSNRAIDAGFESLLDYYYFLRYDPDSRPELDRLVEALVVGETYLFREFPPVEVAVNNIVVPLIAAGKRPRIWSAACATGEEPHTIAMSLAARSVLDRVDLVASDINSSSLARARSGRFSKRAIRGEVPLFAARWVEAAENGVHLQESLTRAIDWRQINLMDDAAVAELGTFDVIFCRNVLIYFNDPTVRRVVDRLAGRLTPGGALFVGISESLLRFGTSLRCEEHDGVFLYRRVP